jgi:hypothetical protein
MVICQPCTVVLSWVPASLLPLFTSMSAAASIPILDPPPPQWPLPPHLFAAVSKPFDIVNPTTPSSHANSIGDAASMVALPASDSASSSQFSVREIRDWASQAAWTVSFLCYCFFGLSLSLSLSPSLSSSLFLPASILSYVNVRTHNHFSSAHN